MHETGRSAVGRMPSCEIAVRLQPRARADEIVGEREGVLVVRVTAPPAEGRANAALCRLLARRVGVARRRVAVVHGLRGRDKRVRVEGLDEAAVRRALAAPPRGRR